MHTPSPIQLLACLCLAVSLPAQGDQWFTVSPADNSLRRIDPFTAATLGSVGMTTTGATIVAANGLATNPLTNELWTVVQIQGQQARSLARVDPQTGVVTRVGSLSDRFAGIAFNLAGVLYGVTGDGASSPETLYTLNLNNAQATFVVALGNGTEGETIGFHPPTGRMFHASGSGAPNNTEIFESINLNNNQVTNVPISVGDYDEALAMTWLTGDVMLVSDLNFDLWAISTSGALQLIGSTDHDVKGIANLRTAPAPYFAVLGSGCPAANGVIPILAAR